MAKLIQLKLSQIKYGGDSIGDDIRIEVECLNRTFGLNKQIKNADNVLVNVEIGQFPVDHASPQITVTIRVIEQDLIFNDVGTKQEKFKLNLNTEAPQYLTSSIEVREIRGYPTKKKALFAVTIEARVSDMMLYVAYEHGVGGWTNALPANNPKPIGLPAYLKVMLEKDDGKRQYFKIMEGILQGTDASVKFQSNGTSYLQIENPQTESAHLVYSRSHRTLKFHDKIYATRDYAEDPEPWKNGHYDIEIPDASHKGGEHYLRYAKLAKVWFRIGHSGARYLHTGAFSLGCVTLTEHNRWDDLCKILMRARKGDSKSIGVLEVVD